MYDILQLNDKLVSELKEIAQRVGVKGYNKMNKQELVYKILDEQALAHAEAAATLDGVQADLGQGAGQGAHGSTDWDGLQQPLAVVLARHPFAVVTRGCADRSGARMV